MKTEQEYQDEIAQLCGDLAFAKGAESDTNWRSSGDNRESYTQYYARLKTARKKVKQIETKIAYRERKIMDLTSSTPVHHDIFGQELKVGCRVAWSTSGRYAGAHMGYINGVTRKMVQVGYKAGAGFGSNVFPKNLIVVDLLVEWQENHHG